MSCSRPLTLSFIIESRVGCQRREGGGQLRAQPRRHLDFRGLADHVVDAVRDAVDLLVVHDHAVEHQRSVDSWLGKE